MEYNDIEYNDIECDRGKGEGASIAATVEQIARQIKTLTGEEQAQLRTLLGAGPFSETSLEQERQFARHLLAQGMLDYIPSGYPEGYREPPAITLDGEPLSEAIIRERR